MRKWHSYFQLMKKVEGTSGPFLSTAFPHYLKGEVSCETLHKCRSKYLRTHLANRHIKISRHQAQVFTDTAHSYGALMLSVVFCKGAWQWHLNCSVCMLPLYCLLQNKRWRLFSHFAFFFFCKSKKKTSSDFFALAKPGTNVGMS